MPRREAARRASPGSSRPEARPTPPRGAEAVADCGSSAHLEPGAAPSRGRSELLGDPLLSGAGPCWRGPRSAARPDRRALGRAASSSASPARRSSSPAPSSRSISARQRSAWAITASIEPPCFRFSRSSALEPLLDLPRGGPAPPRSRRRSSAARAARSCSSSLRRRTRSAQPSSAGSTPASAARPASAVRRAPPTRPRRPRSGAADAPRLRRRAAPPRGGAARAPAPSSASSAGSGFSRLDLVELEAKEVEVALARALPLADRGKLPLDPQHVARARRGKRLARSRCSSPANPSRVSSWAEPRA